MKAVIELDVPKWQIGQEVHIFFPDTMELWATVKEQEPVEPIKTEDGDMFCGNCGETVGREELNCGGISMIKYKYCPECGRKAKWNEDD